MACVKLLGLFLLIFLSIASAEASTGTFLHTSSSASVSRSTHAQIPIYYVNLDSSLHRRQFMKTQLQRLGLVGHRVRARTNKELHNLRSNLLAPRKQSKKELACIVSHLTAIHRAIADHRYSSQRYAIIIEDDVNFEMNIEFNCLVISAPPDFALLQLTTSNLKLVKTLWEEYVVEKKNNTNTSIWMRREINSEVWSTQAYLIDKLSLRPFLSKAFVVQDGEISIDLISPNRSLCDSRVPPPDCLLPFRMVADTYIYSIGTTYVTRVPMFNSAENKYWDQSTIQRLQTVEEGVRRRSIHGIHEVLRDVRSKSDVLPQCIQVRNSSLQHASGSSVWSKRDDIIQSADANEEDSMELGWMSSLQWVLWVLFLVLTALYCIGLCGCAEDDQILNQRHRR